MAEVSGNQHYAKKDSFSEEELSKFRIFCSHCDKMKECRFVKELPKQEHNTEMHRQTNESWETVFPDYDDDDFRSFMTLFRQLIREGPINVFSIMKILSRHASEKERLVYKEIKKSLAFEANSFGGIQIAIGKPGEEETFSPEKMILTLFNAEIFHSDMAKQDALRKLKDFKPFVMPAIMRYITIVAKQAVFFSKMIKNRGYVE
jgi:hypothetical protein